MAAAELLPRVMLIGSEANVDRWRRELQAEFVTDVAAAEMIVADGPLTVETDAAIIGIGLANASGEVCLPADYQPRELVTSVKLLTDIVRLRRERTASQAALSRLDDLAHTDPLTGLLNRRGWDAHCQAIQDKDLPACVALLDLDHFKTCNDSLGWSGGDHALAAAANTLRNSIRPGDVVARWGGDEFAILLKNIQPRASAKAMQRIWLAMSLTDISDPPTMRLTASIGCAFYTLKSPDFAATFDLCQQALRDAKSRGGNIALFADPADSP